ncbi:MAG: hypothetical protein EOO46_20535, partial [Flavobacterium sp.]
MNITITNEDGDVIKKKTFLTEWFRDDNMRQYEDMGIYPPGGPPCPENEFNMWIPFEMEEVTEYKEDTEGMFKILLHFYIFCSRDADIYDVVCKWIGQNIQKPGEKSVSLVSTGQQGSGKSWVANFLKTIFGQVKVMETESPSQHVWGQFNNGMEKAFLVVLNELDARETRGAMGKLKGLITKPTITINKKGLDSYVVDSYHRFYIPTNHASMSDEGLTTDNRRFLIVECSSEKIGQRQYFEELNALLQDTNV